MGTMSAGEVPAAARQLRDLAREYADRALRSQADIVRAFESDARPWIRGLGEVVVDDDDDERIVLTEEGRFVGSVVDPDTSQWEPVDSPEDVADHYDPVDLFTDLADAIEEMFPGLIDPQRTDLPPLPPVEPPPRGPGALPRPIEEAAPAGEQAASSTDQAAPETEQLRVLEDLHRAGAITDSQLDEAKANLTRRPRT